MRVLYSLALFGGLAVSAAAQNPYTLGAAGDDAATGVARTPDGGVIVGGWFEETVDANAGPGTAFQTSQGFDDGLLIRLAADGAYVWSLSFGSASGDRVDDVAADAAGNVYLVGHLGAAADMDPGPASAIVDVTGSRAVVVASYTADGQFRWAFPLGAGDVSEGGAIVVDGARLFVTGAVDGASDFDPGPGSFPLTAARDEDAFVASYTLDGALRWAFLIGAPSGASYDAGHGLAVQGNSVWVAGAFSGTVDFQGGAPVAARSAGAGFADLFVARYAADGPTEGPALDWVVSGGEADFDYAFDVAVDPEGNAYAVGAFRGATTLQATTPAPLPAVGARDAFLVRLNGAGGVDWAHAIGGTSSAEALGVDVADNAVFLVGSYSGTTQFPTIGGSFEYVAVGVFDGFIARYSLGGPGSPAFLMNMSPVAGTDAENEVEAVVADATGLWVGGSFQGTSRIAQPPLQATVVSQGARDLLAARLDLGATVGADAPPVADSRVRVEVTGANPSRHGTQIAVRAPAGGRLHVSLVDALGRTVGVLYDGASAGEALALAVATSALAPGVYVVRAVGDGAQAVARIAVSR